MIEINNKELLAAMDFRLDEKRRKMEELLDSIECCSKIIARDHTDLFILEQEVELLEIVKERLMNKEN